MEQCRMKMFFLAFVVLSQAEARSVAAPAKPLTVDAAPAKAAPAKAEAPAKASPPVVPAKAKKAALVESRISPPLEDVASDKKFFGPPFPADYPEDKRPAVDKSIMDKLKGPGQPYPALQSKSDFDRDYVKDENSDRGDWKAQFEYDSLRKKLAKEAADAKAAEGRAGRAGKALDDAQKKADAAGKDAGDAMKGVDDARNGEDASGKGDDDFGGPPSAEKLEQLKKAVAEAEAAYEKEKKDFEECKKALEDAKTNLEELKAKQVEMEQQLAAETKLWVDTKATRLNLKKTKEDAAHSKTLAAAERLKAAQDAKAEMDKLLADKKAHHATAEKALQKQKGELEQAKTDLAKATVTLQKLRGYKPAVPKSSASMASALLSFALLAMHIF